jgi:hypothetical protein
VDRLSISPPGSRLQRRGDVLDGVLRVVEDQQVVLCKVKPAAATAQPE